MGGARLMVYQMILVDGDRERRMIDDALREELDLEHRLDGYGHKAWIGSCRLCRHGLADENTYVPQFAHNPQSVWFRRTARKRSVPGLRHYELVVGE